MKVDVKDLTGVLLNYYTGLAKGLHVHMERHQRDDYYICVKTDEHGRKTGYDPSHDYAWACLQLEIDRPNIEPCGYRDIELAKYIWGWEVAIGGDEEDIIGVGHTIPEAMCRLIIKYNFGDSVFVPDCYHHLVGGVK